MNHQAKLGLVFLVLLFNLTVSAAQEGNSEFDSFLEVYTAIWNTHNGDSLSALFTVDADLIMGNLSRIAGREAISEWWDTYFSQIDEGRKGEFELLSFMDISPSVLLVNIRSKTFRANNYGKELETRLARGTWVLVKRNNRWLIAAMRGMPAVGENRLRPGVDH